MNKKLPLLLLAWLYGGVIMAGDGFIRSRILDDFEDLSGWSVANTPDVRVELAHDQGYNGMGLRLDFDFQGKGGFFLVRKAIPLTLPDNYAFSFMLRGAAPVNNLEFKLLDPSGANVWWHVQRDYDFPTDWRRVIVRQRQLRFGWGPAGGGWPTAMGTVEIAVAASTGGKGSIWLDQLQLEERPQIAGAGVTPLVTASTAAPGHEPAQALTPGSGGWRSGALAESQWLQFDFQGGREYGGLTLDWERNDYATAYRVRISDDGADWRTVFTVTAGDGGRDYIYLPDAESRYLRLELQRSSRGQGYALAALKFQPYEFSASVSDFFKAVARDAPRGFYPKYLTGEQSYWTVVGVAGDANKGLLNEEGMLETDRMGFSIEPLLYWNGRLTTWAEAAPTQSLEQGYLPIPSVTWRHAPFTLTISACAAGEPGASFLVARYRLDNHGDQPQRLKLYLALRPFQVNPPWQSLNLTGGAALLRELRYRDGQVRVNNDKTVIPLSPPDRFAALAFEQGSIIDAIARGRFPVQDSVVDSFGYASGALEYTLDLGPGGSQDIYIAVPLHADRLPPDRADVAWGRAQFEQAARDWQTRLGRVEFQAPPAATALIHTLQTTLAYILINQAGPAIQPGPRNYARSWIRDGALTSTALLELGHAEPARAFIEWYARYQQSDGGVPCCVDRRGADGTPENDSDGEFIYAVMEYYRHVHDIGFVSALWPAVVKAVEHIDGLRRRQLTDAYRSPELRPFYGLLPKSISHEGYAAKPMHSYWDDFFALRGLKDAADLAVILGEAETAARFAALRDEFRRDLYDSLRLTLARRAIDFLPGSVELGDFDPTSTAIAIAPGGELENLPQPALYRTFEDYYAFFRQRANHEIDWESYAPYELRIVGVWARLGQRQRALDMLNFFLADRRPAAWNHWAEIVWRDPKAPNFIGDMPHTWVGSEYIRSMRSLFAYERETDQALVIAAGLPREWLESETGVAIKRLPTWYGPLNYRLRRTAPGELRLELSGDVRPPPGRVVLDLPVEVESVTVNGKSIDTFTKTTVGIEQFPAEAIIRYRTPE